MFCVIVLQAIQICALCSATRSRSAHTGTEQLETVFMDQLMLDEKGREVFSVLPAGGQIFLKGLISNRTHKHPCLYWLLTWSGPSQGLNEARWLLSSRCPQIGSNIHTAKVEVNWAPSVCCKRQRNGHKPQLMPCHRMHSPSTEAASCSWQPRQQYFRAVVYQVELQSGNPSLFKNRCKPFCIWKEERSTEFRGPPLLWS